ncbi:cytoplasmic protein [Salmonella enterica subsp. enterica]|uniref:Cytoplasmic protein n=1 Tax=Salmonella enterica I TaxID=59201 RepID=A0A447PLC3_SALET|nr:cytoplasmic protein [Salmonella enterica subsp. enterica]
MDMSLTKPVSAEQPCGPDPEYDPEYLLLFSRAAPQAEAQYGDFVSTPEAVNWPEIERDARRLLTRSKDIRVLILLLRSRIQQAGAQGLAEMLTQLAELSVIWSDALHPQLLTGEGASAESIEDAALARSNALAALLDHEGVMADIRGITLSNSAALRLQVRDVERALSNPRPADALAPESVRQQLADLEARGALPLAAFREAQESAERLQVWARETLGDLAPDFSRLRQLLALLPDVVQTTTPEIPPSPAPDPAGTVMVNAVPARAEDVPPVNTPPVYPSHTMLNRGQFAIVMMRWNACGAFVAGLRAVNPAARPSHCYARLKDWWENGSRR